MTERIYIREASGLRRRVDASAFPLAIGGEDSDVALPGGPTKAPVAYLGLEDDDLFVQPGEGRVLCNGAPVTSSQWLRHGDVLDTAGTRIEIERENGSLKLCLGKREEPRTDPPMEQARVVVPPTSGTGDVVKPIAFQPRPLDSTRHRGSRRLVPGALFALALLALGGAAWATWNARAVTLQLTPAPDALRIEGGPFVLAFGGRHLIHPGSYRLVAEKDGYRRLDVALEVSAEREQSYAFAMEQLPGRLAVTTSPEEGAEVAVDGEVFGTSPLEPLELAPGTHHLRVTAPGYRDFEAEVEVGGAGTLVELEARLEPRFAAVRFATEPSGASVRVAGRSHGPTPVTANVLEGTHDYEIVREGYKRYRGQIHVVAGEPQSLEPIRLTEAEGVLSLASDPPGANVMLDGEYQGQTPVQLDLSPGRPYELKLSHPGHESVTREVAVASARTEALSLKLEPQLGEVELVVDPPDAELYINGESRGRAHQTLRLPAAPQRIEIKKDRYEAFAADVMPRPGFPQTLEVTLRTTEEIKKASIRPVIETPSGHVLRLIEGRRFEMGASRREPGRRANESQRTVELKRAFYLAQAEVTNRQFREFRSAHRSGAVSGQNLEIDHHPVVNVSWQDAAAYCNWLSERESLPPAYVNVGGKLVPASPPTTGYRLPTEAEWSLAARYPAGERLKYAWGNALPVAPGSDNYADEKAKGLVPTTLPGYDDGYATTAPAGSFAPNALGLYNLGGNVSEWIQDLYTVNPAGGSGVDVDPVGPKEGELYVIRGASWMHGGVTRLRLTYRDYGKDARPDVGFRIARYLE